MKKKKIRLQKTSNQQNDYILVEAIDDDDNYLFDVSYNSKTYKYEVLFRKNLDSICLDYNSLLTKLVEAKDIIEEDIKTS